jgi:hypothetical protein
MTTCEPLEIVAVRPPRGRIVHLHSPNYKPGPKERPHADISAMCGQPIWPNGHPKLAYVLTPLADALRWTCLAPSDTDPRPVWTWCRGCIGHAIVANDLQHDVLTTIVRRT